MAAKKTKKSGKQASTSKGSSSKRSAGAPKRAGAAPKRAAPKAKSKAAPVKAKTKSRGVHASTKSRGVHASTKSRGAKSAPARANAKSKATSPKAHAKPARPSTTEKAKPRARRVSGVGSAMPSIEAGPTELGTIKLAYLFRDTTPADIYRALMDAAEHSAFTGDLAEIDARVGGEFRSYSGFIYGTTLELVPDARIVQSWRTKHFPENNPSSTLELTITPVIEGSRLDMRHLDVPKDQVEYIVTGWVKHYLDPLAKYLGRRVSVRPPAV